MECKEGFGYEDCEGDIMFILDSETTTHSIPGNVQHDPLGFIEKMTLCLCKSQTTQDLIDVSETFLEAQNLELLQHHAQMCIPLSYVWSNTIRRIVFTPKDIIFPNLLLLLPPLYHRLDWLHEGNEEWDAIHNETLSRFESCKSRHDAIMLLFLEGMKYGTYEAMLMFKSRTALFHTHRERSLARQLQQELLHYAWPEVDLRHLA